MARRNRSMSRRCSSRRDVLGETHPSTLVSLNNLAGLYESQGRYGEAEPLYEQALQLRRDVLGRDPPLTARKPQQSGRSL